MKMWIARDENGKIYLFPMKPKKYQTAFIADDWWHIDQDAFPEVTFENSPMEVELVIKK